MIRGSYVAVIVPNEAMLMLPFGARKFVRLSKLKNSARNSRLPLRHGIGNRFDAAKFTSQTFGPRYAFLGALPNGWLGSVGAATPLRLNQFCALRWSFGTNTSPMTFGR